MYKLTVFIPQSDQDEQLEQVKAAMFSAGAGQVGNYADCCWQVLGMGQFTPLAGSQPHIGVQDKTECVAEWRVECIVPDDCIDEVLSEMKRAHPYETPAYDVIALVDK